MESAMNNGQIGRRQKAVSRVRVLLKNAERGEDTSFEFTAAMLPMAVMITLIAMTTLVRSSQVPLWTAALSCARAAAATLDESIGTEQGEAAGRNSLANNNISGTDNSDPVQVSAPQGWGRGKPVTCEVSYTIDVSGIPGFSELVPGGGYPMSASVTLPIDPFKSKWDPNLDAE
jgi:hypothetical protein